MRTRAFRPVVGRKEASETIDSLLDRGHRYAYSLAHDRIEADDLLQDACLSILASGGTWSRAYLFTTIRNRFIDRCRRNRKILFLPIDPVADLDEIGGAEIDWELPDVLQNGRLERALGSLRPEEREALFLAAVEGYTAEEIGVLTNRPRGTILSLLYRAKAKLRDLLREEQVLS